MHDDEPEHPSRGEILIVEDTPASLKLLSDLLIGAGYYVRQAPNGELALWTARSRPPELILLDIRMPGIDGFEVCRRLKESPDLRDVPVIFLSAQHDTEDKVRGFAAGAVDFIAKPFQADEVLARSDTHIRLARAQQALAAEQDRLEQRVAARTHELEALAHDLNLEIGRRRAADEFLRLSGRVFDASLDGIIVTDANEIILLSNPALSRMTGYTAPQLAGRDWVMLAGPAPDAVLFAAVRHDAIARGLWSGELDVRRQDGTVFKAAVNVSSVLGQEGELVNYVMVVNDISERTAQRDLIDFMARHDALTGLPNRAQTRVRFEAARAAARAQAQGPGQGQGGRLAVLSVDIDHFKSINDSYGQATADKVLQWLATYLATCVRDGDTVSRNGGDEFQLILRDDSGLDHVHATAQCILDGLRAGTQVDGRAIALTASIGIALYPDDGDTLEQLLRHADTALVQVKQLGRNDYAFFTASMERAVRDKLTLQTELRSAIQRQEFTIHYQPQVDMVSGALCGAEALLRWNNQLLGAVPPNVFIPLAEEFGLIWAIGVWVLRTVCEQLRHWRQDGLAVVPVSINVSGSQFSEVVLAQLVAQTLQENGLDGSCLGIEITESAVMDNPEQAIVALKRLKDIGVSIAIDDFGTGYSSLAYLKRFPIDVLKIDKSFVDDVASNSLDAAIALSVISLAHNLNMRVVAEGVEQQQQVDFLRANGCDEMQGYFQSRPVPVAAFTALLKPAA